MQRGDRTPEWPYPVRYDKETRVSADVLVLGGGIAGCHAALSAARRGASVIMVEKGGARRSGQGGAGVDHWQAACTNPCSTTSPEEYTRAVIDGFDGYDCGPLRYTQCRESWDAALDCERMGVQIRDVHGEFEGAEFRDPATRLLFAYDYESRHDLRVYGHDMKPCLHREVVRRRVKIFDRVMATALLTENGREGAPVVGATGVNVRTGEFYVFRAKATVLALAHPRREWVFSTRALRRVGHVRRPEHRRRRPRHGLERGRRVRRHGGLLRHRRRLRLHPVRRRLPRQHLVRLPDGRRRRQEPSPGSTPAARSSADPRDRFRPAEGQKFMLMGGGLVGSSVPPGARGNYLDDALVRRIRDGELRLPLYADLPSLPEHERRAIFGLMVGNEGKSRVPVYENYTSAGFDPDHDMLQAPIMPPDAYESPHYPAGTAVPQWRETFGGGLVVDWDLRSSLEGLYAAGRCAYGGGDHSGAATSGRYAGRKAAAHAGAASPRPASTPTRSRPRRSASTPPCAAGRRRSAGRT